MMDTDKLLRSHGIGPATVQDYGAVALAAQGFARSGLSDSEIVVAIRERFVPSEGTKLPLKEIPEGVLWILGDVGTDIEHSALDQMKNVMRIPPAQAGSLMPDAHQGYAMPIG